MRGIPSEYFLAISKTYQFDTNQSIDKYLVNKKICLTVALAVVVVEAAAVVVVDSSAVDFAVVGFAYPVVDFAYRVVAFDFVSPSGPDPFDLVAFDYGDQLHFDLHLK